MISRSQSPDFPNALQGCRQEMHAALAELVRQHGCVFWIALTAVIGDDLWQLQNKEGCTSADVEWILNRLGPETSPTANQSSQHTKPLFQAMTELIERLSDREYWRRIRKAEKDIRALEGNLEQKHELLVTGATLADFLQTGFARLTAEGAQDVAQDLWQNIRETAFASERR